MNYREDYTAKLFWILAIGSSEKSSFLVSHGFQRTKHVSVYEQEIPQSHTADQTTAP